MIQIFAVAACFTFPQHPNWDTCKFLGNYAVYQTAEQCERYVQANPPGVEPDRIITFKCFTKTTATWEPVK
jgi:hypothetical protein